MMARAASGLLVSALIRRVEAVGGHAMVLHRGDATAGALLFLLAERGVPTALIERTLDPAGVYRWTDAGPAHATERDAYIARRRKSDPDLWVVELDVADAARIVDEVAG